MRQDDLFGVLCFGVIVYVGRNRACMPFSRIDDYSAGFFIMYCLCIDICAEFVS